MSYQVLARKWRPQRFSEVVGQQHVLSALENSLREGRLHHAYLFSGTRGVGKTSIARLFAKGLNCEVGITATPCGNCANCKAIEEGRFIDLIEIDAASRTKVEDTRELLDNVQYKPTVGRFKVYLIDEVHMLSRSSFNALLKTLEEPPEYVKFLLATTDPQKLPITILSRCMQLHLRALDQKQIGDHLEFILKQEQIPYEPSAIEKLAKAAQGSIRDSLSLTDQAIAVSNANVTLSAVSQMLGLIDDHQPLDLIAALANADGEKAMAVIQQVAEKGGDWQHFLSDLAENLHQIAMLQLIKHAGQEETQRHFLAKQIPPEDVQFFYQLMLTGKKELPFAPEPRAGVEMTILRALAFHPKRIEEIANVVPAVVATSQPSTPQLSTQQAVSQAPQFTNTASHGSHSFEQMRQQIMQNRQATNELSNPSTPQMNALANSAIEQGIKPENSGVSLALQAKQARKQLQEAQAQFAPNEKKKPELVTPNPISETKNLSKMQQVQSHLAHLAEPDNQNVPELVNKPVKDEGNQEDYRWTWLNPELENQNEGAKPSEIKQAILQARTPELVAKTIMLSCQQDRWCDCVNGLELGGFSRQIALNCYVESEKDQHLQLVLKPNMAHLDNPESRHILAQALEKKGLTYAMRVGDSHDHQTPLEIRRRIFEQLTEEARKALLSDSKLQLLREAFEAELDESTIRAVVSEDK